MPRFPTLNEDLQSDPSNKFLLSYYGNEHALGFKGTKEFVKKGYNLAYNYGITNGSLLCFDENFCYVLTTKDKLYNGLVNYFVGELKYNNEIPTIKGEWNDVFGWVEEEYDEKAIENLAKEKAENFIKEKIIEENFMSSFSPTPSTAIDFYEMSLSKQKGSQYLSDSYSDPDR